MDGRTSERLRSNRSIMGVLDGVSSEAVVVHQERCAKVRNRNVACLKCADACTSGCIVLVDGELTLADAAEGAADLLVGATPATRSLRRRA